MNPICLPGARIELEKEKIKIKQPLLSLKGLKENVLVQQTTYNEECIIGENILCSVTRRRSSRVSESHSKVLVNSRHLYEARIIFRNLAFLQFPETFMRISHQKYKETSSMPTSPDSSIRRCEKPR